MLSRHHAISRGGTFSWPWTAREAEGWQHVNPTCKRRHHGPSCRRCDCTLLSGGRREAQRCVRQRWQGERRCLWGVLSRQRSPRPWKQRASARQVGDRPLALPERFRFALTRLALTATGGVRSPRRGLGRPRAGQFERKAILRSDVLWVGRRKQQGATAATRAQAGHSRQVSAPKDEC